jgi:3-hydroxyacyl-[acyl-carrier-protein] dehydratase
VILAKITTARFHREALAGERLLYDVELLTLRPEGASVVGKVYALPPGGSAEEPAGAPLAEAEIFFAHLDQSRSQQIFGSHNFVFGGELKQMLGLAKLAAQKSGVRAEAAGQPTG